MFGRLALASAIVAALGLATACSNESPSWPRLIEARITSQYPAARVSGGPEFLEVDLAGRKQRVEVAPLVLQCNRGHADCETAMTTMLLGLQ